SCNYCDAQIEHRENRLASHLAEVAKCSKTPAAARTGAHILMAAKKSGKRSAPDSDDESPAGDVTTGTTVVRESSSSQPPTKKRKEAKQMSLDGVVDRPMTTAQSDSANRKLLRYFIHSNTAFVNADNIFLSDFTNEIRPSFEIASRTTM
ncbi:hypothetical protein C8F01DRAFT_948938, partial [Mycena amicta]